MATTTGDEPRDLSPEQWAQWRAMERAYRNECPRGDPLDDFGAELVIAAAAIPGLPAEEGYRRPLWNDGVYRLLWVKRQQAVTTVTAPSIPVIPATVPSEDGGPDNVTPMGVTATHDEATGKDATYLDWLRTVRDDERVTGMAAAAAVAAIGARCRARDGKCVIPVLQMAEDWGMSRSALTRELGKLERLGYLRRLSPEGKGRRQRWQLTLPLE